MTVDRYAGLDVSLNETHFCVMDGTGEVVVREREVTHPEFLSCHRYPRICENEDGEANFYPPPASPGKRQG